MAQVERLSKEGDVAHYNMVTCQLRPNGITDPLLVQAFKSVCREDFVPPGVQSLACSDGNIPLFPDLAAGAQRWLLAPLTLARLFQVAAIQPSHRVLIIGCATGYSLAVAVQLAASVTGVEIQPELASLAALYLAGQQIPNARMVTGTLDAGYPKGAPYDVILIEGAVAEVPLQPVRQLKPGGRLVTIIKTHSQPGRGAVITCQGSQIAQVDRFDANCPWLPGFSPAERFHL